MCFFPTKISLQILWLKVLINMHAYVKLTKCWLCFRGALQTAERRSTKDTTASIRQPFQRLYSCTIPESTEATSAFSRRQYKAFKPFKSSSTFRLGREKKRQPVTYIFSTLILSPLTIPDILSLFFPSSVCHTMHYCVSYANKINSFLMTHTTTVFKRLRCLVWK